MIHLLDSDLINKIAAGEVIERPASVVKELLENSIDAGATQITLDIENGGKTLIRISDNGSGMSPEDLKKAPLSHTTSKIKTINDLFKIKTLGFRGEALASISSISSLTIMTKPKNQELGQIYELNYNQEIKFKPFQTTQGTIIEVEDIFKNLPARLKYLKNDYIEFQHILDIVTKYALAYPDIHIKLNNNKKQILNTPNTTPLNNITSIMGRDISQHLIEVNTDLITGFISKPILTRTDKSNQIIFLNKRFIRNKIISEAVNQAYHTLVHHTRHPIFILNINLDHTQYDVNVHPQKFEIRLKQEKELFHKIFNIIKETLKSNDLIQEPMQDTLNLDKSLLKKQEKSYFSKETQSTLNRPEEQGDFRILGQAHKTYIFVEVPEGILVIDQHALQERIFYNAYIKQEYPIKKQTLVSPKLFELSTEEFQLTKNNWLELNKLGFVLEEFGINTYKLLSIPVILGHQLQSDLLLDILGELKQNKTKKLEEIKENIINYMSCRGAIKAGDILTNPEMVELFNEMKKSESFPTCPHGRPIVIRYTLSDLEKLFQRKL